MLATNDVLRMISRAFVEKDSDIKLDQCKQVTPLAAGTTHQLSTATPISLSTMHFLAHVFSSRVLPVFRSKDVVKSGGEWISSIQLENAAMGHPKVLEAAVIGIPDENGASGRCWWWCRTLASQVGYLVSAAVIEGLFGDEYATHGPALECMFMEP